MVSVNSFEHKPGAVLNRSAIFIRAMIAHVLKELIQQVTICTVKLDSIKASRERIFGSSPVLGNNTGNFIEFESARSHERLLGTNHANVSIGRNSARCDGKRPIKIYRVPYTTDVPQLQDDSSSGVVDAVGHALPACDLFFRPDTRGIRIPDAHRRDRSRFGDNQTGTGGVLRKSTVQYS